MEVIRHGAVGEAAPPEVWDCTGEKVDEAVEVLLVGEDPITTVPACSDVVMASCDFVTRLTRHASTVAGTDAQKPNVRASGTELPQRL